MDPTHGFKKIIKHPSLWQAHLRLLLNKQCQIMLNISTLHAEGPGIKFWNGDNLVCFQGDMEFQFLLANIGIYLAYVNYHFLPLHEAILEQMPASQLLLWNLRNHYHFTKPTTPPYPFRVTIYHQPTTLLLFC